MIHIIFSTKDRMPMIGESVRPALHAYLATVARSMGCECYRVGGVDDHVHIAIGLSRTVAVASLVEKLKTSSSKWIKAQSPDMDNFSWQRGYGAFSVGPATLDGLRRYIDDQDQHHRLHTFQEEYVSFLIEHKIEYDERYVWD
jgi:REP element-mobilizing transposase RayT